MNPNFGCNLRRFLFSGITNENISLLKDNLINKISIYVPEITVTDIILAPDTDNNLLDLTIDYYLKISQTPDKVKVQFT
jgi:phage baseplate assembly protein W